MLTKNEKKRVIVLGEKGFSYLEIAEDLLISRGPEMFVHLSSEVQNYLGELEECGMYKERIKREKELENME